MLAGNHLACHLGKFVLEIRQIPLLKSPQMEVIAGSASPDIDGTLRAKGFIAFCTMGTKIDKGLEGQTMFT